MKTKWLEIRRGYKANLSEKIEEIIVPTLILRKLKGKRVQRKKKYFQVCLLKVRWTTQLCMIKNLKKVSGFLGTKGTPIPVSEKEIEKILDQIKDSVVQPKLESNTMWVKKFDLDGPCIIQWFS